MIVYCADIGSIKHNRFGWARGRDTAPDDMLVSGDPEKLVQHVATDLRTERVALGFECPLFIPLRAKPADMMRARNGERNRPWSAGAGLTVLTLGLVQVAWVLQQIAEALERNVAGFLDWDGFSRSDTGLLVWEAFVSGKAKYIGDLHVHSEDARIAVRSFIAALPDPRPHNAIREDIVYSLAGAALLRAGMATDPTIVAEPTLVIKSVAGPAEATAPDSAAQVRVP